MRIGTVRAEEAKVFDSEAGYHQFHNEDGSAYGSFEVFWQEPERGEYETESEFREAMQSAGWYWVAGFPGYGPDGEASGPFASSIAARLDADEFWT